MKKVLLFLLVSLIALSGSAVAEEVKGFQLSLVPDVAIQDRTTRIKGVSIGIWNENPHNALSLGFVNGATGDSSGLMLGFLGNYANNYEGVQFAWLVNYNRGTISGVQAALFNHTDSFSGLQFGLINYARDAKSGLQIGLANIIASNKRWFGNFPDEVAPGMIFVNWRF